MVQIMMKYIQQYKMNQFFYANLEIGDWRIGFSSQQLNNLLESYNKIAFLIYKTIILSKIFKTIFCLYLYFYNAVYLSTRKKMKIILKEMNKKFLQ